MPQTTMVTLCVCMWMHLESETHYGGPSLGYFNANSNSGTSHTLGSGILEVILYIKGPQHGKWNDRAGKRFLTDTEAKTDVLAVY